MVLNSNLLAIDWDRNHVRLLCFAKERAGTVKIRNAVFEPVAPEVPIDNAESFGKFLRELIRKNGIRDSAVVFLVGRERAFLHQLAIPASPEDEVANLVRFQLAQELPFGIEESTVDYVITARNDKNQVIGVLAAAVPTEYIDFLQHLAKVAGLAIRRIGLRSYSNFLAARNGGYLGDSLTLFVDLSLHEIEIEMLSAEGGIVFSRSAGLGENPTQSTPLKEVFLDQAFLHLKRTLQAQAYLAGSPDARPRQILVAGSTGWEKEFLDRAAEELDLTGRVFQVQDRAVQDLQHDAAFVAAYGLACSQTLPRRELFDFLFPKKAVDPQAVKARQVRTAIAVVAAVLILAFIYTQGQVSNKKKEISRLAATNKKMDKELSQFKKFNIQVEKIREWEDQQVDWLEELKSLSDLLPPTDQAYIKHLFVSECPKDGYQVEISIEGQAGSRQIIDQLAQRLADTGRYEVTPGQQATMARDAKFPENFKLNLKVMKEKSNTGPSVETNGSSDSPAQASKEKKGFRTPGQSASEAKS